MRKIILISCVSKKLTYKSKAKHLYVSDLFKKSLSYAQSLCPDQIFILSAKYGLVGLEDNIKPYDTTLNQKSAVQRKKWAARVIDQLAEILDLNEDEFIILAGIKYRQYLLPHISNYKIPLEGLTIGKQLKLLNKLNSDD